MAFTTPRSYKTHSSVTVTSQPGPDWIQAQTVQAESLAQCCSGYWSSPPALRCYIYSRVTLGDMDTCSLAKTGTKQVAVASNETWSFIKINQLTTHDSSQSVYTFLCVLSIDFKAPLFEDYGPLKSKCPCLTYLKWLSLFTSWVRPHFNISEHCPGRHKPNEKARASRERGERKRGRKEREICCAVSVSECTEACTRVHIYVCTLSQFDYKK